MKQIKMLLMTCAVLFATSCSEKNDTPSPAQQIAKEYQAATLVAKNGGISEQNAVVKIEAVDESKVNVLLANIVNGATQYTLPATVVYKDGVFILSGGQADKDMQVQFTGTIQNQILDCNVAVTILPQDIVHTWTFNATGDQADFMVYQLTTKSGKVNSYLLGQDGATKEVTTEEFNQTMNVWLQLLLGISLQNPQFKMQKDGYFSFSATCPFVEGGVIDKANVCKYSYNTDDKELKFDVPLSQFVNSGKSGAEDVMALLTLPTSLGYFGVPFDCTFDKGVMTATITPEVMAALRALVPTGESLEALLAKLDPLVPAEFQIYLPILKNLARDLANGMTSEDTQSITIGGKLQVADK